MQIEFMIDLVTIRMNTLYILIVILLINRYMVIRLIKILKHLTLYLKAIEAFTLTEKQYLILLQILQLRAAR